MSSRYSSDALSSSRSRAMSDATMPKYVSLRCSRRGTPTAVRPVKKCDLVSCAMAGLDEEEEEEEAEEAGAVVALDVAPRLEPRAPADGEAREAAFEGDEAGTPP